MGRTKPRIRRGLGGVLIWLGLGFAINACVAKPPFHCQSDESCISTDGSQGTCEASGECTFRSALDDQGGGSEAGGANVAGSGHGGSAGEDAAAGEADGAGASGSPCTDEAAGNCYACSPKTSAQFLNACTTSSCVPFDDRARLTNLSSTGELPPLPSASGQ